MSRMRNFVFFPLVPVDMFFLGVAKFTATVGRFRFFFGVVFLSPNIPSSLVKLDSHWTQAWEESAIFAYPPEV